MTSRAPATSRAAMLIRRADEWLFQPAPALRLACFRVLTGVFAVVYLVVRLPAFLALDHVDSANFTPVGILAWMDQPLGAQPVRIIVIGTVILGVAYTLGVGYRVLGPLFAVALLVVTTYRSSGGQLLWFENLLVVHVLIVGFTHAADALAWTPATRTAPDGSDARDRCAATYGWPLRLAALVTVMSYVLAGVAKLRSGGLGWMSGESLRNHVAFSAARLDLLGGTPSPVARLVVPHVWLFVPMAVATMIIELGAPIALLCARCRWVWVVAAWAMHAAIAASMYVVFPYPLALIAFAPLFALERLPFVRRPRSTALVHDHSAG